MNETQENIFYAGWLFTLLLGLEIKQVYPTLAEEAALSITFAPMLILLIALQKD